MTESSTHHTTFVIERTYAASPARVFGAWAEPTAKARWFKGSGEARSVGESFDFRVGGRERVRTQSPGGSVQHLFDCEYRDILPDRRIVYCYDMFIGERRISVSLATVEFEAAGTGTRMVFTEQAVFVNGYEDAGSREHGTNWLVDQLGASLQS